MKSLPVAVQVYSVRDDAEKDYLGTLKKLKAMGYDGVELAGTLHYSPEEMKAMINEAGLTAVSAHVSFGEFKAGIDATAKKYRTIGCDYVALPFMPEDMRPNAGNFAATIEEIETIGKACAKYGVALSYHNHDFEFLKMDDGTYCLDYIYKSVPPELLKVQPDVCWIHVGGVDPADYIRKYPGRIDMVHLKDYLGVKAKKMYAFVGEKDNSVSPGDAFRFKPVGGGNVDMPSVLEASLAVGAKWVIVEQDNSLSGAMLDEVKASRDYLKSLGW